MNQEMDVYGVIMCGGSGTRLWPWSRSKMPKQCLPILDDSSLMEQSLSRLKALSSHDVLIVTTEALGGAISDALDSEVSGISFLHEPMPRNTAMCIGLAASKCFAQNSDSLMIINTADHDIDQASFLEHARGALKFARDFERIVTFGIKPTYPSTAFGYIEPGIKMPFDGDYAVYEIASFHEKPNASKAVEFVNTGRFSWNSGMFVARSATLLEEFRIHMPELYERLVRIRKSGFDKDVIAKEYEDMTPEEVVQFDVGIAEKSQRFAVLVSDFAWQDIGNWHVLSELWSKDEHGNVLKGDVLQVDSQDCLVFGKTHTAVLGMKDVVVVNMGDTVLVCPKDRAPEVGGLVKALKKEGRDSLI